MHFEKDGFEIMVNLWTNNRHTRHFMVKICHTPSKKFLLNFCIKNVRIN